MSIFRNCFLLVVLGGSTLFGHQKVVLFNDTSAWYHWGCTGTSTALKEGIQELGFDLVSFPINAMHALKEVPPFEEFNDSRKYHRFCEENKEIIEAIQSSTAVVITGEGTIHDLRNSPRALLYLAHISKTFLEKHVEIINHSAYPQDDPILSENFSGILGDEKNRADRDLQKAQAIYKSVYDELDFIAIREPFSQAEMQKIDISSTLSFDCLPLYIRDHYRTKKQVQEKTLVIAGSVAFSKLGAEKLCRYLEIMSEKGFKPKILIGAAAFPAKDDLEFVGLLKTHCNVSLEIIHASSMEEWLDTINHATLLVSGRFHHSIAAFCLNTPFIALNSNTPKVHAICSLLEQPEPLLFSDTHLLESLLSRTESILHFPIVQNDAKVEELNQLARRNFEGLKSIIRNDKVPIR